MLNTMVADSNISRDLKPSQELLKTLAEAKTIYEQALHTAKDLVVKAYQLAIRDGFKPQQARQFIMAELPFLSDEYNTKGVTTRGKGSE